MSKKKQVAIYLTEDQNAWLSSQADKLSIAKTFVVQGLIDKEMKKRVKK